MSPSSTRMPVGEGLAISAFHPRMERAAGEKRDLAARDTAGRFERPGHMAKSDFVLSIGFSPATSCGLP
jgi:hypothetical protein